jgi:methionine sulfoxide reductase heme-binding subunit
MARSRTSALEGWPLVLVFLAITVGALTMTAVVHGTGEDALRSGLRTTARLGALVFSLVFAAWSLNALFRTAWSRWLLRNRRYLGLGFGVIHLGHGALIILLAVLHPVSFQATTDAVSLIGGSVGYVFVILMMATSFDGAVRLLGRRRWQALHKVGMYVLWGIFAFSYVPRAALESSYIPWASIVLAVFAVRVVAFFRRRAYRPLREHTA